MRKNQRGFTLVEMIVVVAVLGILVAIVIPALLTAVDRSRQRKSMADMRTIAKANGMAHVDYGQYVGVIANLAPTYILDVPATDGWGNPWGYLPVGNPRLTYRLRSGGRDGVAGPAPPDPWHNEPFEADLIMDTGHFTQMPTNR